MSLEAKIKEIGAKYGDELLKKRNVVGYSNMPEVRKRAGRDVEGEECFTVFVTKKLPKEMLDERDLIPKEIDGIPTDVVEVGEIYAL